jgi:hydroxymethylbilane synthase
MTKLRVGTRGSQLAVTQCKRFLNEHSFREKDYEIVIIKTTGDIRQEERFTDIGVKGVFVKELDDALVRKEIDFAIHSFKDLPSQLHPETHLVAVSECLDARDAFVSAKYGVLDSLPQGSVVGSSSARRKAQLLAVRKDLVIKELRGNVDTRIRKMRDGEYDAIILAAAGMIRMGRADEIRSYLDPTQFVPCIGQGIIGITALKNNQTVEKIFQKKRNPEALTHALLLHEFMVKAEGGCSVPLGCHLEQKADTIDMWGFLADPQGQEVILEKVSVPVDQKFMIVSLLLEKMEKKGFRSILKKIHECNTST